MSGDRIDWSQLWYPGPTRVFTDAELARAGQDRPSRTVVVVSTLNVALTAFTLLQVAPQNATALLTALLAGACMAVTPLARSLLRRPSRKLLMKSSLVFALLCMVLAFGMKHRIADPEVRQWAFATGWVLSLLVSVALTGLTLYRSQQIASRLRELDERDRAVEMATQLATAQIQPHFLFNSLASLQHWVQQKDDRAAPMLAALTSFLRATLPLFNSRRLRLGDEAEAVRQYLEVMRLRLGDRLRFKVTVDPRAAEVQVPPGLLLTLTENAVEHGVQPSLHGADIDLVVQADAGRVSIVVRDTGPGLVPGAAEGVGLSNTRARLAQAYGDEATLTLRGLDDGGCEARIELPFTTTTATTTTTAPTP